MTGTDYGWYKQSLVHHHILELLKYTSERWKAPEITSASPFSRYFVDRALDELEKLGHIKSTDCDHYIITDRGNDRLDRGFLKLSDEQIPSVIRQKYNNYVSEVIESNVVVVQGESVAPLEHNITSSPETVTLNADMPQLDQKYLISSNNWFSLSEIAIETLLELLVRSTILLRVQITDDNRLLWRYTYFVFEELAHDVAELDSEQSVFTHTTWRELSLLFDLALSERMQGNRHQTRIFSNLNSIAAYMSYPLLEGLLKILCHKDIKLDGTVKRDNRIRQLSQGGGYYDAENQCSSLLDLLVHYETNVAHDCVASILEDMRSEICKFGAVDKDRAYGLIYTWRNTALHGEMDSDYQYGIILNIICILLWGEVADRISTED